jgi:hypothetical protein
MFIFCPFLSANSIICRRDAGFDRNSKNHLTLRVTIGYSEEGFGTTGNGRTDVYLQVQIAFSSVHTGSESNRIIAKYRRTIDRSI